MSDEKRNLRRVMKAARESVPAAEHAEKSLAICHHIAELARQRGHRRLGLFWPLGSEVDLRPLLEAHPDWQCCFPKVSSTRPPRLLWGPLPLEPGRWGLQEPVCAQHPLPPVDLLVVPGLAFDPEGFRLGYGGGFYDALLNQLDAHVITLAAGFDLQRVGSLPVDPLDQSVQGLVTESGLTWFHASP